MNTRRIHSSKLTHASCSEKACAAFTRIDLLVTLIVIACIAPLIASHPPGAPSSVCLDNMKKLALAMNLYAADNSDLLPPNPDDGNTIAGHNWYASSRTDPSQATNWMRLVDPRYNLLATYSTTNYQIYKCPADSSKTSIGGKQYPSICSISMSQAVGTICPGFDSGSSHSGAPSLSVHGPWLDGSHGHKRNSPYRCFGKLSDFYRPSLTWIFIDEDPYSINDGGFGVSMIQPKWIDWPATYHDNACGLSFADGHSEIHKWVVASTKVKGGNVSQLSVANDKRDWQWLADRTSSSTR